MASVRIEISDLWSGDYDERRSIAEIDAVENTHIHGRLTIVIDDRELPRLGYFGPDDVCLNEWVVQFLQMRSRLATPDGRHVFDECEQGQPAFAFERSGQSILVSVLPSEFGDGPGDDSWTKIACDADELLAAIDRVLGDARSQVTGLGPQGEHWWKVVSAGAMT